MLSARGKSIVKQVYSHYKDKTVQQLFYYITRILMCEMMAFILNYAIGL